MFIGIIWSVVWNVITGIVGGEWLGQGGTSTSDTPPQPLPNRPEGEVGRPVIAPKPFIPSGRSGVKVNVSPPPAETAPRFESPPTIKTPSYIEPDLVGAGLPDLWKWSPVGASLWLIERIRKWDWGQRDIPGVGDSPQAQFKFGKLLTGNMSLEVLPRWEWIFAVDDQQQKDHHQESFDAYAYWLANQTAGVPFPENYTGDFYDQGAIIWPLDPRDFSGGVTMLFGARFLGDLFANWWTRSLNYDAATLRGVAYFDIEITQSKATWDRNYSEDTSEVDSESGFGGLADSLANIIYTYRASLLEEGEGPIPKPHIILQTGGLGGGGISPDLEKILAVKDFPFKVPVSLLLEPSDLEGMDEEELDEKAYEQIESIPQLILWLTRALDELIGKFPITMEIGETDLLDLNDEYAAWKASTPEEDDSLPFYLKNDKLISYREEDGRIIKTVKVPNLAEAVAEMMGSGLAESQRNTLLLEIVSRALFEIGSNKNVTVNANAWIEAIADYLGFATTDKVKDVEYTYNPVVNQEKYADSIIKQLEPTKVLVALPEYDDKQTMETHMVVMREIHGIVKAALTEGIGKTDGQLFQRVKDFAAELGLSAPAQDDPSKPKPPDEFDQLLEQIERGFIDQPGITDVTNPYGREYNKRPRIRRLTNENPED
jgi:hypothetical protein